MYETLSFNVYGRRLEAIAWGLPDADPVLALHGWLDNAASFMRIAPLMPAVRFIALDLAGHGRSSHRPAGTPYYIWDNVADVIAVADQLGLRRFALLGHSMGAGIASMLAGAFPDRVRRLLLIEGLSPLAYDVEELPALMAQALDKRSRLGRRALKPYLSVEQAVQARMNGRWPVDAEAAHWLVERGIERRGDGWHWRSDPALLLPSVVRLSDAQIEAFLRRIESPVTLILGDRGIDTRRVDAQQMLIRRLQRHTLVGGHHLHLEAGACEDVAKLLNAGL